MIATATTPTAAPTTTRRTLRHSALRALGPVRVMLTSHPRPSRFKGQLPYVCLQVQGDQTRYALGVENDGVAATLQSLPLNVWVTVQAFGRDAAAYLAVEGQDTPAPMVAPAAADVAPYAPSTPIPRPDPYAAALDAAVGIVAAFRNRFGREPSDAERAIATTLFIQKQRA